MPSTRHLTCFEHQEIPIGPEAASTVLSPREAELLSFVGEHRPGFCVRGHRSVKLAQYCGVLGLGERSVEILPKVTEDNSHVLARETLLRLVKASNQLKLYKESHSAQQLVESSLLDVFIASFFDCISTIMRAGLTKSYVEIEDDLPFVRGRINLNRQFSILSNRPDTLSCRFDDHSVDNVWNRIIKGALRLVKPWIKSPRLERRWFELMSAFEEVRDIHMASSLFKHVASNRHVTRYEEAIQWADWITRTLSPALRTGFEELPSLLFDMNQLFQAAMASTIRRKMTSVPSLRLESQCSPSYLASIQEAGGKEAFALRPDLIVYSAAGIREIWDTKWKLIEISESGYLKPAPADMYQICVYAARLFCDRVALIYPWYPRLATAQPTVFHVPLSESRTVVVSIICVDVTGREISLVRSESNSLLMDLFN